MTWVIVHIVLLTSLLALLKKRVLGQTASLAARYVVIVYGTLFVIYLSGGAFLMNPYNNKLYKNFETQDWVLMALTNAATLVFMLGAIWFLIRSAWKWSKKVEVRGQPIADSAI